MAVTVPGWVMAGKPVVLLVIEVLGIDNEGF